MNIEQLRHFSEIAKCGSISKAAEIMYTTHQNLSSSIKKLEKELGSPVFRRTNQGVCLTEFGEKLLPYARNVLSLVYQMPGNVFNKSAKTASKLVVAAAGFRFVSWIIGQLYDAHADEGIHIDYHDLSQSETLAMVASGTADIGVYSVFDFEKNYQMNILENAGVEFISLVSVPITVTVGRESPLYSRKEDWVTLDMLKGFPVVYRFVDYPTALQKQLGLLKNQDVINCNTRAVRTDLLLHTKCVAIGSMPTGAYDKIDPLKSVRVLKIKDVENCSEKGYIKRKNVPFTPLAGEFAQRLVELLTD